MSILLEEEQVRELLDMSTCISALEQAFRDKSEGLAPILPRRRLPILQQRFIVMAGALSKTGYGAVKAYGIGEHQDTLLYKVEEGLVAVIRSSLFGAMRTGAASGLATKYMARPDAARLGCFGTGLQAATQIEAIAQVRRLESVLVFGRDAERRESFAAKMSVALGMEVRPAASAEELVTNSDVIVTMTNSTVPVFDGNLIQAGSHINAAGANRRTSRELDATAVARAAIIAVDDLENAHAECGDLDWMIERGLVSWDRVDELAHVVAGLVPGRRLPDDITLFESMGVGIEDVAVASILYERAKERGLGTTVPL